MPVPFQRSMLPLSAGASNRPLARSNGVVQGRKMPRSLLAVKPLLLLLLLLSPPGESPG